THGRRPSKQLSGGSARSPRAATAEWGRTDWSSRPRLDRLGSTAAPRGSGGGPSTCCATTPGRGRRGGGGSASTRRRRSASGGGRGGLVEADPRARQAGAAGGEVARRHAGERPARGRGPHRDDRARVDVRDDPLVVASAILLTPLDLRRHLSPPPLAVTPIDLDADRGARQ